MLGKVFVKYMERYADTYNRYGDSQKFLEVVHKSLEGLNLGDMLNYLRVINLMKMKIEV